MEDYLEVMDTYLDEMDESHRELLALYSESYVGSEDNFVEALDYAENKYDGVVPDGFNFFQ